MKSVVLLYLVYHVVEDRGHAQHRDLWESHPEDPVKPTQTVQDSDKNKIKNLFIFLIPSI